MLLPGYGLVTSVAPANPKQATGSHANNEQQQVLTDSR